MRVGKLNRLVRINKLVKRQDAAGGKISDWEQHAVAWAAINPISGKEKYYSHEKHATATHQITTRYIAGLEPKMQITHDDRVFEIVSVIDPGDRHKQMQIIATEEADHD